MALIERGTVVRNLKKKPSLLVGKAIQIPHFSAWVWYALLFICPSSTPHCKHRQGTRWHFVRFHTHTHTHSNSFGFVYVTQRRFVDGSMDTKGLRRPRCNNCQPTATFRLQSYLGLERMFYVHDSRAPYGDGRQQCKPS